MSSIDSKQQSQSNDQQELLAQQLEARSAELPTRLIDTKNGVLVDSYQIVNLFKNSQEYANLTQRLKSTAFSERTDLIKSFIDHYFSYATLSHRWGDPEPLHKDLQGSTTHDLPPSSGVEKLLGFCAVACERGFRWAWSDTCCIDKTSSSEIVNLFKNSQEYANLTQRLKSTAFSERTDLIKSFIDHYFSYATLSHRWGDSEPLHKDLQGSTTHDLPPSSGVEKLLGFCAVACERGFRWAWSDTCCIDKTSSSEVQESINSMFHWYRASALTIVYLADVAVTEEGVLRRSKWFKRGWTLQELLAPRVIQFYKSDWTSYIIRPDGIVATDNDKAVPEFAQLLSEAARVDVKYLTDFTPSTENVREKMHWVAHRATTKVEDMAYCLSGIFGIFIPILYGEKDRAFMRLQEELLKQSGDLSLFDWVGEPSKLNSCFASHPRCFHEPEWAVSDDIDAVAEGLVEKVLTGLSYIIRANLNTYRRIVASPPPGHALVNGRMRLTPHAFFAIKSVQLNTETPDDTGNGPYSYTLTTIATEPMTIITPEKLEEYSFDGLNLVKVNVADARYTLVRLGNLRGMESHADGDLFSLGKPFTALLLEQRQGERTMQLFRRILTTTRITAQLKAALTAGVYKTFVVE
ncbi:HET-domain-containing protein [Paxillus ammoniavirescens]|nr:HET-domain-containing protein [Paxillus ammoniavirescens]